MRRGCYMDISKTREGNVLTVTVVGELNTATSDQLQQELVSEVKPDDTVIFELADLTYITSAGLRALMTCDNLTGRRNAVILRNVRDEIRDILELTGFDSVMTIL